MRVPNLPMFPSIAPSGMRVWTKCELQELCIAQAQATRRVAHGFPLGDETLLAHLRATDGCIGERLVARHRRPAMGRGCNGHMVAVGGARGSTCRARARQVGVLCLVVARGMVASSHSLRRCGCSWSQSGPLQKRPTGTLVIQQRRRKVLVQRALDAYTKTDWLAVVSDRRAWEAFERAVVQHVLRRSGRSRVIVHLAPPEFVRLGVELTEFT